MRIPRFYFPDALALGARVSLPKEAAHHALRVLRMAEGDRVTLFNGDGLLYHARIVRADKQDVVMQIEQGAEAACESPLSVTLVQGISSGERMDFSLQKSVELGVEAIQPIQAERSVVKLSGERKEKRLRHWQQIVIAACEQCGRNVVPEVRPVLGLMEWLGETASGVGCQALGEVLRIQMSPEAELGLRDLEKPTGPVELAVGPEGGFSEQEHTALRQCGFVGVKLGPRVLRTETAGLAALAAMQIVWGDF